ncbi:MAG: hypothetical protein ACRDRX_19270 [Pseudonocardiaceae bacterium]
MTRVPSISGTRRRVDSRDEPVAAHSWWPPRWLRRQREERELARWVTEVSWQWSDAVDDANLTRHSQTAAKIPVTIAPQVHSVEPGPPVTLLVRMLAGQTVDDFQTHAQGIADGMGVPMVHIEPYDTGWITVSLLDHAPESTATPRGMATGAEGPYRY